MRTQSQQLLNAAKTGNLPEIKRLLAGGRHGGMTSETINSRDHVSGYTALGWACLRGHVDVARMLVDHPLVDINVRTNSSGGHTALHLAVAHQRVALVQLLLKQPDVRVNAQDHTSGWTPLHFACSNGNVECLQLLLRHPKIAVKMEDPMGRTAFDLARGRQDPALQKIINEYFVSTKLTDDEKTILAALRRRDRMELERLLKDFFKDMPPPVIPAHDGVRKRMSTSPGPRSSSPPPRQVEESRHPHHHHHHLDGGRDSPDADTQGPVTTSSTLTTEDMEMLQVECNMLHSQNEALNQTLRYQQESFRSQIHALEMQNETLQKTMHTQQSSFQSQLHSLQTALQSQIQALQSHRQTKLIASSKLLPTD